MNFRIATIFCFSVFLFSCSASAADWPQWGRTAGRNMASPENNIPAQFTPGEYVDGTEQIDLKTTKNVKWVAKLGSQSFGNATVAAGRIFLGTNNDMPAPGGIGRKYKGDRALIVCLDEKTGKLLWQFNGPKLGAGKVGDWEYLGVCSSPAVDVEAGKVYFLGNLCEVICLDINGIANGNDGPYKDEAKFFGAEPDDQDADVLWRFNLTDELGVFPHNITSSSPLVVGDTVYVSTSNGVDWSHLNVANPRAPCLVALNKNTGELVGEEVSGISKRIMHCNWSSPAFGKAGGRDILVFGAGDGRTYGFDPKPVWNEDEELNVLKELWRVDCNAPHYRADKDGKRVKYATPPGPSEVIGTPVLHEGKVYVTIGQDPEHGEGVGMLTCIDAVTGKAVWRFDKIRRSISTPSVAGELVYIADYSGRVFCVDAKTGAQQWMHDTLGHIWGSTLVADGKVYLGNEDGILSVFATGREKNMLHEIELDNAIYSSPVVANGVLYIGTQSHLYAIAHTK